jgi:hypothetical protein
MSRKDDFCVFCGKDVPQRTITQVMEKLAEYHKGGCALKWPNLIMAPRRGQSEPVMRYRQDYDPPATCTCGLDDLAAVLSGSREQEKIMVPGAETNQSEASHEQRPTAGNPDIWCDVCNSWRYTQPCGRDECPR